MLLFHNTFVSCLQHKLPEPMTKMQQEIACLQEYSKRQSAFRNNYIPVQSYKLECLSPLKVGNDTH